MYIPEFWCGVGAIILVEFIIATTMIIISTIGKEKRDDENTDDQSNQ